MKVSCAILIRGLTLKGIAKVLSKLLYAIADNTYES